MAADVTCYVRHREEPGPAGNSEILITKDFLGEFSKVSNSESNHSLKQPEQGFHERCNSPNSPLLSRSSSENKKNHYQETNPDSNIQDLNYPPTSTLQNILFPEETETCLELKLQSSSRYQSVCTLDKVKSALQRAEKETTLARKRSSPTQSLTSIIPNPNPNSNPNPNPSSSATAAMFAAACPGCLLYVITLKTNPKCPRCNSTVPCPLATKKAKIDLNSSA